MRIKSIIVTLSLLCFPLSGFAKETLNKDQLSEIFTNKTIEWQHLSQNMYGKTYYAADGVVMGTYNGEKRKGKWHISENEICVSWGCCAKIESDGSGNYYKSNSYTRVIRIKIIGDGNLL